MLDQFLESKDPSSIVSFFSDRTEALPRDNSEKPTQEANPTDLTIALNAPIETMDSYVFDFNPDSETLAHTNTHAMTDGTAKKTVLSSHHKSPEIPKEKIAGYTNVGHLGEGGMGMVLKVKDETLNRTIALKVLKDSTIAEEYNFLIEAQITAQLQHPGIIPIHEYGNLDDGQAYFTMQEIKGRTFRELIQSVHSGDSKNSEKTNWDGWNFRRLLDAFYKICETMAYVHSRGVVHRDLKPQNIMIGEFGEVFVVDWGIAKVLSINHDSPPEGWITISNVATRAYLIHNVNVIVGTPAFMAPEQVVGNDALIGPESDIYALGAILHQILTGRNAFSGTPQNILSQKATKKDKVPITYFNEALRNDDKKLNIPNELVKICEKAMQHEPTDRFDDAKEMGEAIQSWLEGAERNQKALEILNLVDQKEATISNQKKQIEELHRQLESALDSNPKKPNLVWELWQKKEDAIAKVDEMYREVEISLHGALVYNPEHQETYRRLIGIEYREYLNALMRGDLNVTKKIAAKLKVYLEMVTPQEQSFWKKRREVDIASMALLRKRQGRFIDRATIKGAIQQNLQTNRWVSLIGTAGIGKTHLALEAGKWWGEKFQAETIFCDATISTDLDSFIQVIGKTLDISLKVNPEEDIVSELKSKGPFLFFIDNLEQVVKVVSGFITKLLEAVPDMVLLTTSRIPSGSDLESEVSIPTMSLLEGILLFNNRAQLVNSSFELSKESIILIAQIVVRLDNLPLAIELAASRVSILNLQEIADHLEQSFELLQSPIREKNQVALLKTLDWSWNLLDEWSQSTLAQCSVFQNGFTMDAVMSVIDLNLWPDRPLTPAIIESLVDDNLLIKEQKNKHYRYSMLASIHEYASLRRNEPNTPDEHVRVSAIRRHATYYAGLEFEKGSGPDPFGVKTGAVEIDNLISAVEFGFPEDAFICCQKALLIINMLGPISRAIDLTATFISRSDTSKDQRQHIRIERVSYLRRSGNIKAAREESNFLMDNDDGSDSKAEASKTRKEPQAPQMVPVETKIESPKDVLCSEIDGLYSRIDRQKPVSGDNLKLLDGMMLKIKQLIEESILYRELSFFETSRNHLLEALDLCRTEDQRSPSESMKRRIATCFTEIGNTLYYEGELSKAAKHYDTAIAMMENYPEGKLLAQLLMCKANTLLETGKTTSALRLYKRSFGISEQLNDHRQMAILLGNKARLFRQVGKPDEALGNYREAISIITKVGDLYNLSLLEMNLGNLYRQIGEKDKATKLLNNAIDTLNKLSNPLLLGYAQGNLGEMKMDNGNLDQARRHLEISVGNLKGISEMGFLIFNALLAQTYAQQGYVEQALDLFTHKTDILESNRNEFVKYCCRKARVLILAGQYPEAEALLTKSKSIVRRLNLNDGTEEKRLIQEAERLLQTEGNEQVEDGPNAIEGRKLYNSGDIALSQSIFDEARRDFFLARRAFLLSNDVKMATKALNKIADAYYYQGRVDDALSNYQKTLHIADSFGLKELRAEHLRNVGNLYYDKGDIEKAIEVVSEAVAYFKETNNQIKEAIMMSILGAMYSEIGWPEEARIQIEGAIDKMIQVDDVSNIGNLWMNLGLLDANSGDFDKSFENLEKAYRHFKKMENPVRQQFARANMGFVHSKRGAYDEAVPLLKEAIGFLSEQHVMAATVFKGVLALILAKDGRNDEAVALIGCDHGVLESTRHELALFLARKSQVYLLSKPTEERLREVRGHIAKVEEIAAKVTIGPEAELRKELKIVKSLLEECTTTDFDETEKNKEYRRLIQLSLIELEQSNFDKSMEFAKGALTLVENDEDAFLKFQCLVQIATIHRYNLDHLTALEYFLMILEHLESTPMRLADRLKLVCLGNLASIYIEEHQITKANECVEASMKICKEVKDIGNIAKLHDFKGQILNLQGKDEEALACFREAIELNVKIGDLPSQGMPLMRIAQHFITCQEYTKALEHLDRSREIFESVGNSASLGRVLGCMGRAYFELGDLIKARTALEQAIEIYSGDGFVQPNDLGSMFHARIAKIHAALGNADAAQRYCSLEAMSGTHHYGHYLCDKAHTLFLLGESKEAKKLLEEAGLLVDELTDASLKMAHDSVKAKFANTPRKND